MRPFTIGPKVVAYYGDRSERTVRRMCERGELEADLFGGEWAISIAGIKRRYWRVGRDTWRRIIYNFYSDEKDAEEAYREFCRIESEERGKLAGISTEIRG